MADLSIASAPSLTGATLAGNDLLPVLDVSASAGSKGSKITVGELFTGRALVGGTAAGLTGFGIRSSGAAFDLTLATSEVLTAGRKLSFLLGDADRALTVPATGIVALLGTANVFTRQQTITQATANEGILASTGYSLTGSNTTSMINYSGTVNTSAVVNLMDYTFTETAMASNSTFWRIRGGASGTAVLASLAPVGGGYRFSLPSGGMVTGNSSISIDYFVPGIVMKDSYVLSWSSTGVYYDAPDVSLCRRMPGYLGMGIASSAPSAQTIGGMQGLGTNITGGSLNFGTQGTGTGTGGVINLQTHGPGASGTALGTLVNVLSILAPGQVKITGIPTSSAGLVSGTIYSNAGILNIVP